MQTRNTVLMAVVLVAISAFVYFYEIRGRETREEAERLESLFVDFEMDEVTAITLTNAQGTVSASKQDAEWTITAPVAAAADGIAIDRLVESVRAAERQRVIVEAAEDLAPFGLDEPFATLRVERGDLPAVEFHVGKETPVGGSAYAAIGDTAAVYAGRVGLRTELDKSLFDLRDRSLFSFDSAAINRVEIEGSDINAALNREDGGWAAEAPFTGRADADSVDALLRSVSSADAEAFVTDDLAGSGSAADYGLDTPRVSATFRGADDAAYGILIGAESTDPEGFYAMREGGNSVFVVNSNLLDDFPADAAALRNRQVVAADRQRVAQISIERPGGSSLTLERQGVEWTITAPSPVDADSAAVSRLLSGLVDLRAEDFGSAGSASTATIRLGLRDAGADDAPVTETLELRVGVQSTLPAEDESGDGTEVYAVTAAGGDTAFLVPTASFDSVLVDLFDLREKTLVEFAQDDLESLEITADGNEYRLIHDGDAWALEGGDLGDTDVADVLWDLNYLSMQAVAHEWTDAAPDLSDFGLGTPRFRVVARAAGGVVADVRIGAEVAGDDATASRVYALVGDQAAVYEIDAALADVLAAFVEALGS